MVSVAVMLKVKGSGERKGERMKLTLKKKVTGEPLSIMFIGGNDVL